MGEEQLDMTVSNRFIFDVDGTLTPSRRTIDEDFQKFFTNFCDENYVYLITGSDYPKTVEQLGKEICEKVEFVYNCSGNDVWEKGKNIFTNEWYLPETAHDWLSKQLSESKFYRKTGLHFEHRPGMVNFSIVGRNANLEERFMYVEWDEHKNERNTIAKIFCELFPDIEARVGGETGIDIYPKGSDKSQIVEDFDPVNDILHFFGDRMDIAGNDYPLKKVILDNDLGFCYNIKDYKETWKILQDEFSI